MLSACRRTSMRAAAALSIALAASFTAAGTAQGGVYKWVDENGTTHYTVDRAAIPQHIRSPLRPSGERTAVPPKPAPVALPDDVDPEDFADVPAQDVEQALTLADKIERDREALKEMISKQGVTGTELANDPKLREIADRLPELQNESDKLKKARD
jgi:hypothetical protein